jgi:2-polyprenyl-3-methyl-5-hydroxy-6-metoxy-1,4-benzoquinol methylase
MKALPKVDEGKLKEFQAQLEGPAYRNILGDLEAFTGFDRLDICSRSIKKTQFGFGAKGWFNEEFAYFNPRTAQEYDWFYRASQIYLFSNSRRHAWGEIAGLGKGDQPILDYGAGIGQNVLELHYRGLVNVWYMEIGALQTEFFRFRMKRHGFVPKVIEPYQDGRFDTCGCLQQGPLFKTIIAQDVFEHVHRYERILKAMVQCLADDGCIIEQSPFARVAIGNKTENQRSTRVHLADRVGLPRAMAKLGMRPKTTKKVSNTVEVRTWIKG